MNKIKQFFITTAPFWILALLAIIAVGCGTLEQKDPQSGATTNYVVNPEWSVPLKTVNDSGLPYAGELAGLALAGLTAYAGIRNRRLRKTAKVLVSNVDTALNEKDPTKAKEVIKRQQRDAGVRSDVDKLL
jgi:hypothetical protein